MMFRERRTRAEDDGMPTYLSDIFSSDGFLPHGFCLLWEPWLLDLHVLSDGVIAFSYLCIPGALLYFLLKRDDVRLRWIVLLFCLFIVSCAGTHAMAILTLWKPLYLLDGIVKAVTAIISFLTAAALWLFLPHALALPSNRQLDASNRALASEIGARTIIEQEFRNLNQTLEARVAMRTAELSEANARLQREVENRQAAEASLLDEQARLRSILDIVPDAIISIDERGVIQSFSRAAERVFGYGETDVLGRNIKILMPSPYREQHDTYLGRYRRTRESHIIGSARVVMGQRADGTTFPMDIAVTEVVRHRTRGFTGFVRDLTLIQQKERRFHDLQAEVLHASRLSSMGRMASAIAHELNQPLTAITNYLQGAGRLLRQDNPAAATIAADAIGKAAAQAARAGGIIRELRAFLGRGEVEHSRESVGKAVEEAVSLALVGSRDQGIALEFRNADRTLAATINRIQIQQVVLNLVRNAIEAVASSNNRHIVVSVSQALAARFVEVAVADNGPGLAPEVQDKLFQPFVSTKSDGMGLGLSICREIVESHGGTLTVGPNPGGGAIFRFTLPMSDAIVDADAADGRALE
jgi:two-component system sensor kinase FixL